MSSTAADIINAVRDMLPDPVYDGSGNALPDTDGGLVRAQTLYRYLTDGLRAWSQKTGWKINDWTGFALTAHVPHYDLNEQWQTVDELFAKGWRLGQTAEGTLLWPSTVESGQPVVTSIHRQTSNYQLRVFPAPTASDPTSTLSGSLTNAALTASITSTTGFLPYGLLKIDNELLWYYALTPTTVSSLIRGVGGTTAAAHSNGATVSHYSIWVKGSRTPNSVSLSTDALEIPLADQYPLQLYVLSRCRQQEQEYQESARLMQEFDKECQARLLDARTKLNQGQAVKPYGETAWGPLAWGRVVVS